MPTYNLPNIEHYPTLLKPPVVIEQRLSSEEVNSLRSPLERLLVAQSSSASAPAKVDGTVNSELVKEVLDYYNSNLRNKDLSFLLINADSNYNKLNKPLENLRGMDQ